MSEVIIIQDLKNGSLHQQAKRMAIFLNAALVLEVLLQVNVW